MSNILSVKSSLRTNLMALFTRFGLGHLLCRMSLEKQAGVPAVQLILSLCLFRIAGESIHSMYKKSYYDLLNTGHNCYYRMLRRATMDWRKLLLGMALRFWQSFARNMPKSLRTTQVTFLTTLRWRKPVMALSKLAASLTMCKENASLVLSYWYAHSLMERAPFQ